MNWVEVIIFGCGAYLAGSVPFAFLIAKSHGVDLRRVGSGNIGATNCGRALGKKWGLLCFVLDLLKGALPTLVAGFYFGWIVNGVTEALHAGVWLGVGVMTMLGHIFPVWLKFKGGKGVATGFGLLLAIWPYLTVPALVALGVWIILVKAFRYVSLASIAAAVSLPIAFGVYLFVAGWELGVVWPFVVVTALMAVLVTVRHRSNIQRLLAGTESKLGEKKPDENFPETP